MVVIHAPVLFGVSVALVGCVLFWLMRSFYGRQISSLKAEHSRTISAHKREISERDERLRISDERHKAKDEHNARLSSALNLGATGGADALEEKIQQLKARQQRTMRPEQIDAFLSAIIGRPRAGERIEPISIAVHPHNHEAQRYAEEFERSFSEAGLDGGYSPLDGARIPSELCGLVIRVADAKSPPRTAVCLSDALKSAGLKHRIESISLWLELAQGGCQLVVGRADFD